MLIGYLSANSFNFDAALQNKRGGKQCDASVIRIKVCDISECSLIFCIP